MTGQDKYKFTEHHPTGIVWNKTREDVWHGFMEKIDDGQLPVTGTIRFKPYRIAMAAAITVLTGLTILFSSITKNIEVPAAEHRSLELPDHSHVQLNAKSTLSYKPFWWFVNRTVTLSGEGYFKVQPGKAFTVSSGTHHTVVLGTSFNVYSRNKDYRVTCITGKVKVANKITGNDLTLEPGQMAVDNGSGEFTLNLKSGMDKSVSWISGKFTFTGTPLTEVLAEIGRQYDILITTAGDIDYFYSGAFNKGDSAEKILELVCKPFNLEFTRKNEKEYIITSHNNR